MFVRKKFPQSNPVEAHQIGQTTFPDVTDVLQDKQTLTVYESIDGKISSYSAKADLRASRMQGYWLVIERSPTLKVWLINPAGFNEIFTPVIEDTPVEDEPEIVVEPTAESEPEEIQVKRPRTRRTRTVESNEIFE